MGSNIVPMQLIVNVDSRPPGTLVFEEVVRLGRRFRVLMLFGETLRPLLFLSLRPDGSIVVGPGKRANRGVLSAARRASRDPLPDKVLDSLGERPVPLDFHLTFHTSGIISNHAGARTYRAPLSEPGAHQLCRIDLEHPGYLRPVEARTKDIVLPGAFDLSYALQAQLTVVPQGNVAFFADIEEQVAFIFRATDSDGGTAYQLQLSMFRTRQPWPDETTLTWVSQDATYHGFQG
ncbi:MAG TPA: hypothetical protein VIP11_22630 [Gemmatimonadaceae bacterium]